MKERGQATVQKVLLSDKTRFALLADQKEFEILTRILPQQKPYSRKSSFDSAKSFEKAARESAGASGAGVLITGVVGREQQGSSLAITALPVSTGVKVEQLETVIPSTDPSASLANQLVHRLGPTTLLARRALACRHAPMVRRLSTPAKAEGKYSKEYSGDRDHQSVGQPEKIWVTKGLPDGLSEQAMKSIKSWRFKPARDSNGKPIRVIVPVDVAFGM